MAKLPRATITYYEHDGKGNINVTITDLIRCKDCKYYNSVCHQCGRQVCAAMNEDDYCSYAKLRGDSK